MATVKATFSPSLSGSATVREVYFFAPAYAGRVVSAQVDAGTVGTGATGWDVRKNGATVFSSPPTLDAGDPQSDLFTANGALDDFAAGDKIAVLVTSTAGTPPQDLRFRVKLELDGVTVDADTLGGQSSNYHLSRANHTGSQTASTISDFATAADARIAAANIDADQIADGSVSNAEFQYLGGVTSDLQTQIDGKAATSHNHSASDLTSGTIAVARLPYTEIDGTLDGSGELSIAVASADTKKVYGLAFSDEPSAPDSVVNRFDHSNTTHLKFKSSNAGSDTGLRINGLFR